MQKYCQKGIPKEGPEQELHKFLSRKSLIDNPHYNAFTLMRNIIKINQIQLVKKQLTHHAPDSIVPVQATRLNSRFSRKPNPVSQPHFGRHLILQFVKKIFFISARMNYG
ncbi:MAG: hypothetical protein C4518_03665 [Desulfobacteraceae bacterium]|nr:MAG: hypothetical protein C4518_03665 [Desulfobacteraceae bacterium]